MSLYSIIGIILLIVLAVVGFTVKIILWIRRSRLDGFHGFVQKEEPEESKTDEWKSL